MTVDAPARATRRQPAVRMASWPLTLLAVVRLGLRHQRRAPLTWGGGLGATGALLAAMWPSIEGSMDELMRSYPESIKSAFGIEELDSVEKYIDAEMLSLIVPLAVAFFAIRSSTRLTVAAEDRGHLDILLALPLSRRILVVAGFVSTGVMVAVILAVAAAMTWLAGTIAGTGISAGPLIAGFGNVWPLAMLFAGLAALTAGVVRRPAIVTGTAMGVLVAMYFIDLLGKLTPDMEEARSLSVFRYYGSAIQDGFDVSHALGLAVVGAALAGLGAVLFDRRDLG